MRRMQVLLGLAHQVLWCSWYAATIHSFVLYTYAAIIRVRTLWAHRSGFGQWFSYMIPWALLLWFIRRCSRSRRVWWGWRHRASASGILPWTCCWRSKQLLRFSLHLRDCNSSSLAAASRWLVQVEFREPVDWPLTDFGRMDCRCAQGGRICEGARHQTVNDINWHVMSNAFYHTRRAPNLRCRDLFTFDALQTLLCQSLVPMEDCKSIWDV